MRGRFAFPALIAGNVALSFGPWLVRLADVGPVAAGFWRLAIAAPLLALIGFGRRRSIRPVGRWLWLGLAIGGLFFAADLAVWHGGILRTRLANAALLSNTAALLFPLYGFVAARRLPSRAQGAALVLAGAGMALLLGRSAELSGRYLAGDLLCLLAGISYLGYLISMDRAGTVLPPLAKTATATCAGILPLLAASLLMGEKVVPHDWWPLFGLAIGSQVIGQGLIVYAIGAADPLAVGLAFLLQPIVGATAGWLVYGERLEAPDILGAAAIGAALVLVRRERRS